MKFLSLALLLSVFTFTPQILHASDFSRDYEHRAMEQEMLKFVEALTFDELLGLLIGLTQQKEISPYSILGLKLESLFKHLEKTLSEEYINNDDDGDEETEYALLSLYRLAYEQAWELLPVMPCAEYYRVLLMQQIHPENYAHLLKDERERITQLFANQ